MAGRYKAYPEYQDSGVEWLGHVPGHWAIRRLKLLIREVDERAKNQDLELLGLSKTRGVVKRSELEQGAQEANDYSKYRTTRPGELVMNRMQAWNGVFALSPHLGMVSPDYAVFRFHNSDSASFLASLFRTPLMAGEFFRESRGMGTAFLRLNTADFLSIYVPQPPLPEQKQIAKFLDHETGKIDVLIEKQQALIALLKEKRQAVISHAVTKGLNPDAKMKDSGVEWLGDVPEEWELLKIAHSFPYVASGTTPKTDSEAYYGGKHLWVTTGELREGIIVDTKKKLTNKALRDLPTLRLHPAGSVAIAMYGATIGRLGIFGKAATTNQACCVMPPSRTIYNKYLFYWLFAMRNEIINLSSGGGQPNVNQEKISSLKISAPSIAEQTQIAEFLDLEMAKLDALGLKAESAIELMQERRTALISAAVTGKIDVRDWEPAPEAEESLKGETV